MQIKRTTCFALLVLALSACSDKKMPEPIAPQAQTQTQNSGVIPQAQLDALNKAKNVENVLMQSDQQRREQTEAAQ